MCWAKLGANNGQDDRIPGFIGKVVFKLSWGLTMDRMAGFRDLQDRGLWLSWGLYGQDYRITGLQDYRIAGFTGRIVLN